MKKIIVLVLVSVLLLLAFTSCTIVFKDQLPKPEEPEHEHKFADAWISDSTVHYRKCECGERGEVAAHLDEDGDNVCDACTYSLPVRLPTFVLTVSIVKEDGTALFGSTGTAKQGEDALLRLMVGVEYTLSAPEGVTVVGTTVADGVRTYVFKLDNVTEDVTVTVTATVCKHDFVDATCTAPKTCPLCTYTVGEALGHEWTDADCTTPKTCLNCGETDGEALGHTPGVNASCLDAQICETCGDTLVEALGHVGVDVPGTPATCTSGGLTTGSVCGLCGLTLVEQENIAPLGHTPGDWIVDDPATCTDSGSQHKECQTCGAITKTETVPATGHTDSDGDDECDTCHTGV